MYFSSKLQVIKRQHGQSKFRNKIQFKLFGDVSVGGLLDQDKNDSSKQESKAKNWLFKAPRTVGKAVAAPGLLSVFDPEKGQLC